MADCILRTRGRRDHVRSDILSIEQALYIFPVDLDAVYLHASPDLTEHSYRFTGTVDSYRWTRGEDGKGKR